MNSHVNYDIIHYRHFNTLLSRLKFFKLTYQITKKKFQFFFIKFILLKMDLNMKVIKVELT